MAPVFIFIQLALILLAVVAGWTAWAAASTLLQKLHTKVAIWVHVIFFICATAVCYALPSLLGATKWVGVAICDLNADREGANDGETAAIKELFQDEAKDVNRSHAGADWLCGFEPTIVGS